MARPNKVTRVKVKVIVIEGYILNLFNLLTLHIIFTELMKNYFLSKLFFSGISTGKSNILMHHFGGMCYHVLRGKIIST